MTYASLAAHYRPQTFADVSGQAMITTVLSKACAEESIAPAYLLSGTRGVGKTTIARIFAKALNCVQAPTGEPCNNCEQCHKITQGNHVDVTEIDGASNNSVDDARALREHIGYAAMEGRYKVFIIDEAHMLSRNAFNALLKTLEEPPARVVFIFATTEVHKFPITIISRCQHFIFKRLAEDALIDHLNSVLEKEKIEYDAGAVRLIARRAAGSVRDGMSLLGQSLALGEKKLSLESTRLVLGLAGQEFFEALMQGILQNDCQRVVELSQKLGEQGVDIGFFLRELTSLWRTLFLIREAGANILPSLSLSFDEAKLWCDMAPMFTSAHLHAAWHMSLDAQRKVIHSPEPAAALELLLLNLALMPRLLPIHRLDDVDDKQIVSSNTHLATKVATQESSEQNASTLQTQINNPADTANTQSTQNVRQGSADFVAMDETNLQANVQSNVQSNTEYNAELLATALIQKPVINQNNEVLKDVPSERPLEQTAEQFTSPMLDQQLNQAVEQSVADLPDTGEAKKKVEQNIVEHDIEHTQDIDFVSAKNQGSPTWDDFCNYLQECGNIAGKDLVPSHILHQAKGIFNENNLEISTLSMACYDKLTNVVADLTSLCTNYCGFDLSINIKKPELQHKAESVLKKEFKERADLQDCLNILDATILHVSQAPK